MLDDYQETLLESLAGMRIPDHDEIVNTYVGTTNNIATVTYKKGDKVVAKLTMTYVGSGAADDDRLQSVKRSNS